MKISVFTPTYNRAYILGNLYSSLLNQHFDDFEWVIIDDGSTDNTELLVRKWIDENHKFPIYYYKQENRGKCSTINRALDLVHGELFVIVDSDDYLTNDALKKIDQWEEKLPKKALYCGVSGNMGITENITPNMLFKSNFYDGDLFDRYNQVDGERIYAFFTSVHRNYRYPVFEDEKFMTEAIVYNRMANDGLKMRFYNDIICVFEYQIDGLTRKGNDLFISNPKGYALWMKEKNAFLTKGWKAKWRLWYAYYCEMTFCKKEYRLSKKKCAEYIGAPVWAMYVISSVHLFKAKYDIIIKRYQD